MIFVGYLYELLLNFLQVLKSTTECVQVRDVARLGAPDSLVYHRFVLDSVIITVINEGLRMDGAPTAVNVAMAEGFQASGAC